ncbi:MAG: phosphatase PAP2 family protein [Chitinophagales bacterium]|nr:phosphatase PAP2 family protein [Chitinophagales bacterium]
MIQKVSAHLKKTYAAIALLSAELIIVFIFFIIAFAGFLFIADRIFLQHKYAFDQNAFNFLKTYVTDMNTEILLFFTFLGTSDFLIPANILLISYFAFVQKHKWYSIKIPAISISSLLLMLGLKELFNRPRPLIPLLHPAEGLSFPSGHALTSVTFYGLLIYIIWERIKNKNLKWFLIFLLVLLICTIGFSRVYLRVHYASDVLAGFCVGLIWLVISLSVLRRIERYTHKEIDPIVDNNA